MTNAGPIRFSPFVMGVALALLHSDQACAQGSVPSDSPPGAFRDAIRDLFSETEFRRMAAAERLKKEESWEPYLRTALNATDSKAHRAAMRPVLEAMRAKLIAWNIERARGWSKELRFDYLTDFAATTDDGAVAGKLAQLVIEAQQELHPRFVKHMKEVGFRYEQPEDRFTGKDYTSFTELKGFERVSGDYARISDDRPHESKRLFVHAHVSSIAVSGARAICLSQTHLSETTAQRRCSWGSSIICVNNDAEFVRGNYSIFICDGNVGFVPWGPSGNLSRCVVIANGDFTVNDSHISNCFIYAAGNHEGTDLDMKGGNRIVVGGKSNLILDKDDRRSRHLVQGAKDNPLGVKFVSPAEVGVELAPGVKVVRLGDMKASSPLVKAGLETRDRVVCLNGVQIETAADFRRQLRESLLWGTGLFEIKRGDQTFLRLVKFAEPPKQTPK